MLFAISSPTETEHGESLMLTHCTRICRDLGPGFINGSGSSMTPKAFGNSIPAWQTLGQYKNRRTKPEDVG
jgi:hypothetical protein